MTTGRTADGVIMLGAIIPLVILLGVVSALAMPGARGERRWLGFLKAALISFAGVIVPLGVYLLSGLAMPEWKGACQCGWWDGFTTGKYALAPVALYATVALYAREVLGNKNRATSAGIFCGAVVSVVCFVFGAICLPMFWEIRLAPVLTGYITLWYVWRAAQMARLGISRGLDYCWAMAGMTPFWLWSWLWSRSAYAALPDKPPEPCFVVTAAGRGHRELVGPFFVIERGGARREVNGQLMELWRFEAWWRECWPVSHARFRGVYNRMGPRVAARIGSPWVADLVFLALKPAEWMARAVNRGFRIR